MATVRLPILARPAPRQRRLACATLLACGLVVAALPADAGLIFADSFDAEPGSGDGASGLSGRNYGRFTQWTVAAGTVDLVAQGDFADGPGILCRGGAGKCVDLDGSSNAAGTLISVPIALAAGEYRLSFALAGVDVGFTGPAAARQNLVDVFVRSGPGGIDLFSASATLDQGDPFDPFGGHFALTAPTSVSIVFQHAGGDNFGAVLDDVSLTAVPLPPTAALLLVAGLWPACVRLRR